MKELYFISVLMVFKISYCQSRLFEIASNGKDTLNIVDELGKKQGKWILKGKHKPGTCYEAEQKSEEGKYANNNKIGKWLEYHCNGSLKNQLTFQNGQPDGYAVMYHSNGKIYEEGIWRNNRWVGSYKLYYETGQIQHQFTYNLNGKREGPIKYFYENGQLAVEGNFINGKEVGIIKEYYENGDIKAEKMFNDGALDMASVKEFEPKKPFVKNAEHLDGPKAYVRSDEKVNGAKGPLILNGQNITYNKNKQITKDGLFKDNRLMEGKAYQYDENGLLQRISVYKNGQYVGDAPIEN